MNARNEFWTASLARRVVRDPRLAVLALCGLGMATAAIGTALAQEGDQQIRCLQLQQELAGAQGGGAGRDALPGIDKQIQDATRVLQGTKAAMEDAGCYESFFIFGRGLVRSPKCLSMNDRVEGARRQVEQLQDQRAAILGGGGNRRRQADLQDALARNGCGRPSPQPARREGGGGLFNWFGGGERQEEQSAQPEAPVYRSIDPNGRYRAVCVRTCDGFFFPITYSTYAGQLAQDATMCQANCAAPSELYVYRNPGQEIDQAISLNGTAYKDLPNAFKYRKTYVKGCSCKETEYNPTEIEAASQKAEATPAPGKPGAKKKPAAPVAEAAAPPADAQQPPTQLNLEMTGATANAPAQQAAAPAAPPAPAAAAVPAQPAALAPAPAPAPQAQQPNITKSKTPPAPQ